MHEALALDAEQVLDRHLHVGEEQLGGVLRVQADLLEVAAALEAVHPALDHEQTHARVPLRRVGLDRGDHEVGVDAVGDERLGAVHHVVVAVADRRGAHRREVGADARLGHRDRGDELARRDAREPARPLLVGGEREEVGEADVVVQRQAEPGGADACVLQLLAEHLVVAEVVDAAAAELLGHGHAEEAGGAGLGEQLAGHEARLVPLDVVRRDLALDERLDALAEQLVVLGEVRRGAWRRDYVGRERLRRPTSVIVP